MSLSDTPATTKIRGLKALEVTVDTLRDSAPLPTPTRLTRVLTERSVHPLDTVTWVKKDAVIIGADGVEKFRQNDVEVPDFWEDNTINIVAEKYFRVVNGVRETSAKQMFTRVVDWITAKGVEQGHLHGEDELIFRDELLYLLIHGMYAFNSPVWFNAGAIPDPQCSACFIQSVDDSMSSIMDLAKQEVMLFKGGSGTGGNLSPLRSSWEPLSRGGWASGPVSFMRGFDAFAGVTKSGGTTRRAAKMQVLNIDHPDIYEQRGGQPGFIPCKHVAEQLAHDLYDTGKYSAEWNKPGNVYELVGYQNANNSVRVPDTFMRAVEENGNWATIFKSGDIHKLYKARFLWDEIAKAAHFCGDPGIQFDTTTNDWHTCPESGRINASNPCSEYLFLDETACNLGSLNLLRFAEPNRFKVKEFRQAVSIVTVAKDIIVDAASYPTEKIAENSHKYRTLGLGYTNLGALLTYWGLPYDSEGGRNAAAVITAIMTGQAYLQSALLADYLGPFSEYTKNRVPMLAVMRKHRDALFGIDTHFHDLIKEAKEIWEDAIACGKAYGFRNAQVSVLAPTGTISFLMGADTTGIEPMLGAITYKKVVGEGYLVMPNRVVRPALVNLGYSEPDIQSILDHIKVTGTIHSASALKESDKAVFSEALGAHALAPEAHVEMMAAVQPFISGGISKTVNMPADATPQDIADIYMLAWKRGLKCIAVYRDSCKLTQPIGVERTEEKLRRHALRWGQRRPLEATRKSTTHKFSIAGVDGYITAGEYADGTLGECFLTISKQGSFLNGMVDAFAVSISVGLQYGVPLQVYVDKFTDVRFEPSGFTKNPDIHIAKSLVDYWFCWLDQIYGEGTTKRIKEVSAAGVGKEISVIDMTASLDGPPCSNCGSLTRRSGTCYCCPGCGTTTGCG